MLYNSLTNIGVDSNYTATTTNKFSIQIWQHRLQMLDVRGHSVQDKARKVFVPGSLLLKEGWPQGPYLRT